MRHAPSLQVFPLADLAAAEAAGRGAEQGAATAAAAAAAAVVVSVTAIRLEHESRKVDMTRYVRIGGPDH